MAFDLGEAIRDALTGPADERVIADDRGWRDRNWLAGTVERFDALLGDTAKVGLVARNRPLHVAACLANLAGRRTTAMIAAGSPVAFAATIRALRLPAIVAEHLDWGEEAVAAANEVGTAVIVTGEGQGVSLAAPSTGYDPDVRRSDVALELLSSGTTGPPKRIGLSWHTVASAVADARGAYAGSGAGAPQVMVHPLGNVSGLAYAVPPIVYGRPLVLLDRFSAEGWAAAVRDHRPRRGAVPPAGIAMLLEAAIPRDWLASLDLVAVGGGRLDPSLHDAFEERYGVPVLTAYGATEFGGVIANWSLDDYRAQGRAKRGSAGCASRGVALRIVAADGRVLGLGEAGLLEARVDRIGPAWLRTTDLARIDPDGYLFVEGRADAAINRGGFKIVPDALVEVLREHPGVRDAAVVGLPDPRLGEVPVAAVEPVAGAGLDPAVVDRWLRDRLPSWQVPRTVLVVPALPRTTTMKVSLSEVAALFAR